MLFNVIHGPDFDLLTRSLFTDEQTANEGVLFTLCGTDYSVLNRSDAPRDMPDADSFTDRIVNLAVDAKKKMAPVRMKFILDRCTRHEGAGEAIGPKTVRITGRALDRTPIVLTYSPVSRYGKLELPRTAP